MSFHSTENRSDGVSLIPEQEDALLQALLAISPDVAVFELTRGRSPPGYSYLHTLIMHCPSESDLTTTNNPQHASEHPTQEYIQASADPTLRDVGLMENLVVIIQTADDRNPEYRVRQYIPRRPVTGIRHEGRQHFPRENLEPSSPAHSPPPLSLSNDDNDNKNNNDNDDVNDDGKQNNQADVVVEDDDTTTKFQVENEFTCSVCYESGKDGDKIVTVNSDNNCNHSYCICVLEWFKKNDTCPTCRGRVCCFFPSTLEIWERQQRCREQGDGE